MKTLCLILAVLAFLLGLGIFNEAKSAIHEIESFILFVISAILLSGYGIMNELAKLQENPTKKDTAGSEVTAIGTEGAVEVYKGEAIHEIPDGFTAMGSWFKTLEQAKNYIDKNT